MKELLRLIYDLQKEPADADILFFPRKDTKFHKHQDLDYLQDKFGLIYGRSKRIISGWPCGPNAVAMDVFRLTHENWKNGTFPYKAVLLMEADCVPLRPSWLQELSEEWSGQSKLILGHWDGSGTVIKAPISHVNGNLLFHPKIADEIPGLLSADVPAAGWDMAFWPQMAPFTTPSRLIYNDYRLNTTNNPLPDAERLFRPRCHNYPDNPLVGQPLSPCWLHGVKKSAKAIKYVRERFLS